MSMKEKMMAGASVLLFHACGGDSCVARGTRVKTPDGWTPIERLGEGDAVLAWDHEAADYVETVVTATKKARREVVALAVGNMRLRMTSDHPVWSPEADEYRPASDWVTGDLSTLFRTTRGTEEIEITDRLAYDGIAEVFDISVEHELHNFVADGFVVHNKSYVLDPCPTLGDTVRSEQACACPTGDEVGYLRCTPTEAFCVCSGRNVPVDEYVAPNATPAEDAGVDGDSDASSPADSGADSGSADAA